jgi:hypothetical protein
VPAATFDKERLLELMTEHPEWGAKALAVELTVWNWTHGLPGVVVRPATITNTISRMRAGGADLPEIWSETRPLDTDSSVRQLTANTGRPVAPARLMDVLLRDLRVLDRLGKGLPVSSQEAAKARRFETRMRSLLRVVDIDPLGCPIERTARPDELVNGELVSLVALPVPQGARREADKDALILRQAAEIDALRRALKALGGYGGQRHRTGLVNGGSLDINAPGVLEWFDRQGRSITLEEWSRLKGDPSYNLVAFSRLHGYMVSTLWTGMEPALFVLLPRGTDRSHLVFDTEVIGPSGPVEVETVGGEIHRWWTTEDRARVGHEQSVAWLAGHLGVPPADADTTTDPWEAAGWWRELFPELDRHFRELYGDA